MVRTRTTALLAALVSLATVTAGCSESGGDIASASDGTTVAFGKADVQGPLVVADLRHDPHAPLEVNNTVTADVDAAGATTTSSVTTDMVDRFVVTFGADTADRVGGGSDSVFISDTSTLQIAAGNAGMFTYLPTTDRCINTTGDTPVIGDCTDGPAPVTPGDVFALLDAAGVDVDGSPVAVTVDEETSNTTVTFDMMFRGHAAGHLAAFTYTDTGRIVSAGGVINAPDTEIEVDILSVSEAVDNINAEAAKVAADVVTDITSGVVLMFDAKGGGWIVPAYTLHTSDGDVTVRATN